MVKVASAKLLEREVQAAADVAARRTRLVLVPSIEDLLREGPPSHIRKVVLALYGEIKRRAYLPLLKAHSLDEGIDAAKRGIHAFLEVWPAIQTTVFPWFLENPTRIGPAVQLADDVWSSRVARGRLGDEVCAEFAAAQDARLMIAKTIVNLPELKLKPITEKTAQVYGSIMPLILSADYGLLMGTFAVTQARAPKLPQGVMAWVARSSRISARDAYAKVAIGDFADRPVPEGSTRPHKA
jgi:hypothetical protein